MNNVKKSGSLSKQNGFNKTVNDVFLDISRRLPEVARNYRTSFVADVLSGSGSRSLGVRTGHLRDSLRVSIIPKRNGIVEAGSLRVFVDKQAFGGEPGIYGQVQDNRRGWFARGIRDARTLLESEIQGSINKAFSKENRKK